MAKQNFSQSLKKIENGEFRPLYYLAGREKYFHDRFIEHVISYAFPDKGSRSFNLSVLYGAENSLAELMAAVEGYPMMADRKLVIVRDFEQMKISDAETFSKYLNNPQKTTVLVLSVSEPGRTKIYNEINRLAETIECRPVSMDALGSWIIQQFRQKEYEVDYQAVQFLIDHTGNVLLNLEQEIDKLVNYKNDQSKVTIEDIEQVTGISREANLYALQKALARRQLAVSLKTSRRLLEAGYDVSALNAVLFAFFRKTLTAASLRARGKDLNEIAPQMKIPMYQLREIKDALNNFSIQKLKDVINLLHQSDIQAKTSAVIPLAGIEMLCYKICRI